MADYTLTDLRNDVITSHNEMVEYYESSELSYSTAIELEMIRAIYRNIVFSLNTSMYLKFTLDVMIMLETYLVSINTNVEAILAQINTSDISVEKQLSNQQKIVNQKFAEINKKLITLKKDIVRGDK